MQEISKEKLELEVGKSQKVFEERENEEKMEEEEVNGERNSGGNRWSQQETMELLRVRSELDVTFKEAMPGCKAHVWDEVSRKMNELGYQRNAKKCKEKFENIYKYHKRLKNCSFARTNKKAYRFFDQLEALGQHQISSPSSSEPLETSTNDTPFIATPISNHPQYTPQMAHQISSPSSSEPLETSTNDPPFIATPISNHPQKTPQMTMPLPTPMNHDSLNILTSTTSTSGSESEGIRKKKKRKWEDFFDILEKTILEKQEALQNKFLEAIDKSERERQARDQAWKLQEMERIKRGQELLIQERSISAAKDAAILAFLQKLSEQGKFSEASGSVLDNLAQEMSINGRKERENGENSSSRWPKEEVETLVKIKMNMELEYQKIGPKGPLWEDISIEMKKAGYDRNAKRCKEKWENINKYYRRVKDNNKSRHVDSKTCPYFHLLDTLYSMKTKRSENSSETSASNLRPEELLLHMMNHQTSKQIRYEPVVLHQDGRMVMQYSEVSQHEEGGNKEGGGGFQGVARDSLSMNNAE